MITSNKFENHNFFIYGLGRSGLASVDSLARSYANVYAWDDNEQAQKKVEELDLKNVFLQHPDIVNWDKIDTMVLSPGIPLNYPEPHAVVKLARKYNCQIICDIELLYNATRPSNFIGITGTNGKSTTTSMIGHVFSNADKYYQLGGNIGIPVLELEMLSGDGTYIVEVSSYQLDLVADTRFHISILLNITPDHLDRHGGMEGYIKSKTKIFEKQQKGDIAVIGIDNENSRTVYNTLKKTRPEIKLIPISVEKRVEGGVYFEGDKIISEVTGELVSFDLGDLKYLPGRHNRENVAACFAACHASDIDEEQIIKHIKSFKGLRHRIQLVREINGVKYINDSKATNAEAASKALASYDNIYWILGGVAKDGGIEELQNLFPKIRKAYLIGESQDVFANTLNGKVDFIKSGTLNNALESARIDAERDEGDKGVVLLSPACASFDQWKDFEKRGDDFCQLVSQL